ALRLRLGQERPGRARGRLARRGGRVALAAVRPRLVARRGARRHVPILPARALRRRAQGDLARRDRLALEPADAGVRRRQNMSATDDNVAFWRGYAADRIGAG